MLTNKQLDKLRRELTKDKQEWLDYWLDRSVPPEIFKKSRQKKYYKFVADWLEQNGYKLVESPFNNTTYLTFKGKIISRFVIQINPPPEIMCKV